VVALVFPSFRDGRAYSQARLLRETLWFSGRIARHGQVLRDQFVFMLRAASNAFEVKKQSDARRRLPTRQNVTRCSISRPAMAALQRSTADELRHSKVPAMNALGTSGGI